MKRIVNTLGKSDRGKRAYAVIALFVTTPIVLPAQTFTTLVTFDGTDGLGPNAALVQATNGNLYGTTVSGGANGSYGTVFKITPSGMLTTLYSFCAHHGCTDGENPGELIQATNGDFYGTTSSGGANGNYGTVFKISPSGNLITLYSFCSQSGCADGYLPFGKLVQTTDGDFYGTTSSGGANGDYGTVFKITTSGMLTTLYSFCFQSGCADGWHPSAGLVQATNGDFYGTTGFGGANVTPDNPDGGGTVFKVTPSGALTTLYSLCAQSGCRDGQSPHGGLVQATNGDLYGTTLFGGDVDGRGTVFKITPMGAFTALYRFCSEKNCTDGAGPEGALVQADNGDLYGTNAGFGANGNYGTIFKITPRGTLTTLYSFCSQIGCTDGQLPLGGLVQDTNGTFYGTTYYGGANCAPNGCGTVFSLSVGLGPFVETQPASGKVGAAGKILGTDLTGTSSVSFNGAAAVFEVVSSSEIMATVPAGATSGRVKVVTPRRTLSSNVPFRVRP